MKNERIIKKGIFTTIVFVVCLVVFGALALNNPQKKVKADEPPLYYFDIDTTIDTQMSIILYVYDVANLDDNECGLSIYCSYFSPPYEAYTYNTTAQFIRDYNLDYMDWDAYRYTLVYPAFNSFTPYMIGLLSQNNLSLDNHVDISYSLFLPYYPTFKSYYNDGYDTGFDEGFDEAKDEIEEYWQNYISNTYISHTGTGYRTIYQEGYDAAVAENIGTQNWFISSFDAVDRFLNIHIFPNITFGVLLGIPFVIEVVWFIIRQFRGGGSD